MPRVRLNTKEFTTTLKSLYQLGCYSIGSSAPAIYMKVDENSQFQMIMQAEGTVSYATPRKAEILNTHGNSFYLMNPEHLINLSLFGKTIELDWDDPKQPLGLKCGYLDTKLRVSVPNPPPVEVPSRIQCVTLPYKVMKTINEALSLPHVYVKTDKKDKQLTPVRFKRGAKGTLDIETDVVYSIGKIETNIPVNIPNFDILIPKFALDCLYADALKDDFAVQIGHDKKNFYLSNANTRVFMNGIAEQVQDFDRQYSTIENWKASCQFNKKEMLQSIKSINSLFVTKNDKRNGIIAVTFDKSKINMQVRQSDLGEARIDSVDEVSDIYLENSMRYFLVNAHPQAFLEFTNLLPSEEAKMYVNAQAIYYDGEFTVDESPLRVRYLFPAVTA